MLIKDNTTTSFTRVAYTTDKKYVVFYSYGKIVKVRDLEEKSLEDIFEEKMPGFTNFTITKDNKFIAYSIGSYTSNKNTISIWNFKAKKLEFTL